MTTEDATAPVRWPDCGCASLSICQHGPPRRTPAPSATPAPVEVADMVAELRQLPESIRAGRERGDTTCQNAAALIERLAAEKAEAERLLVEAQEDCRRRAKSYNELAEKNDATEARAEAAERDAERLRRLFQKEVVEAPRIQSGLFGVKVFARDDAAPLVTLYVEDDGNWFEAQSFDIGHLDDIRQLLDAARAPKDA